MARVKLSKNALQQQRTQLKLYQKLLPSLDLKRRQLIMEHKKARAAFAEAQTEVERLEAAIGEELPMLADTTIDLRSLLRVKTQIGTENIAGVKVPRLGGVERFTPEYSPLATPAWVDQLVKRLGDAAELRVQVKIQGERAEVLGQAVRRITQRVNLFERVLIPNVKQNIKRIQIYLGELDREAVIRSKLAKSKHAASSSESDGITEGGPS